MCQEDRGQSSSGLKIEEDCVHGCFEWEGAA